MLLRSETRQGETENSAEILLEYVKVLAIDQLLNDRQDKPTVATVAKAVTLQVNPEQAQKVLLAGNVGKLSLVLRQPAEGKLSESRRITDSDLGPGFARPVGETRERIIADSSGNEIGHRKDHRFWRDRRKKIRGDPPGQRIGLRDAAHLQGGRAIGPRQRQTGQEMDEVQGSRKPGRKLPVLGAMMLGVALT